MHRVPFYQHDLGAAELAAVSEVLAGPILTTGDTVERFESRFADFLDCKQVVGVTSCTAALQLALQALDIGPGDEVITTPLTFVATATAILQAGATPVFADVDPRTGNLDPMCVERAVTVHTRAIMPVHLYGQMCDMRTLRALAQRYDLRIVEDAAHCIEGARDGVRPGQLSDAACFSFYATKNLSCGEGGAVATNDGALASKLRLLRLHGMTRNGADRARDGYQHWDVATFGWKYNMDNIHAALLLPQMDRLGENSRRREELAHWYASRLLGVPGVSLPRVEAGVRHAHHLFTIWLDEDLRDGAIAGLQAEGIGLAVNYRPVHLLRYFRERFGYGPGDFPVAERIGASTISLPFYPRLGQTAAAEVVAALERVFDQRQAATPAALVG